MILTFALPGLLSTILDLPPESTSSAVTAITASSTLTSVVRLYPTHLRYPFLIPLQISLPFPNLTSKPANSMSPLANQHNQNLYHHHQYYRLLHSNQHRVPHHPPRRLHAPPHWDPLLLPMRLLRGRRRPRRLRHQHHHLPGPRQHNLFARRLHPDLSEQRPARYDFPSEDDVGSTEFDVAAKQRDGECPKRNCDAFERYKGTVFASELHEFSGCCWDGCFG